MTNQAKESEASDTRSTVRGYSSVSPADDKDEVIWRETGDGDDLELSVLGNADDIEAISEEILLEELKVELFLCLTDISICNFTLYLINAVSRSACYTLSISPLINLVFNF